MIKEYLVKEIGNILDRKLNMESMIRENQCEINELSEHIRLIQDGSNTSDTIFSPGYSNSCDEKKIQEYLKKKQSLLADNKSLISLVEEAQTKLDEVQKVYEYVNKAEHYSNLEKYGKNYTSSDDTSHLHMLETQEVERQRIARDLHDSVVQNMTNIVHKAEYASMIMDSDPIKAKLELKTIQKNTRDIISEIRDVIYNLRPMSFDDIGFDITIERELARLQNISGIKFKYRPSGTFEKIDHVIELTLFRIIQEACNNAIKHSKATVIEVSIESFSDHISLQISDDGIGFDFDSITSSPNSKSGFGLSMMKERVFLLSGKIDFNSIKGKGTIISVDVPLK